MTANAPRGAAWNKFYSLKLAMRRPSCAYFTDLILSMEAVTMAQHFRAIALAVLCWLGLQAHAQAADRDTPRPLQMESVTIGERGTEVLLQFDRPISHERSTLFLVLNGKVIETIHPRLEASPKVLFARIQNSDARRLRAALDGLSAGKQRQIRRRNSVLGRQGCGKRGRSPSTALAGGIRLGELGFDKICESPRLGRHHAARWKQGP